MTNEYDRFQFWLMDMDDAIDRFRKSVPPNLSVQLDFSPESIAVVENLILEKYKNIDEIKQPTEATYVDGAARYIGEVFRKQFGGKWTIELEDRKNAFFGRPQLTGMKGQQVQISPLCLITASTDRRTGDFIYRVFQSCQRDAMK